MRAGVTAIIVSYGHGATLCRALSSLRHLGDDLLEVIVVDNAGDLGETRLGTVGPVLPDLLDPGENLGFSAAVNRSVGDARGEVLLLLSPDARILSWDGHRLAAELDDFTGAIGALTLDPEGNPALSWGDFAGTRALWLRLIQRRVALRRAVFASMEQGLAVEVDWVLGAAVVIRKAHLDAVGGLDTSYFSSGEDQDLGARLRAAGLRTVVSPGWVVHHLPRNPESFRQEIRGNNRRFVSRHGSATDRLVWSLIELPKALTDRTRLGSGSHGS